MKIVAVALLGAGLALATPAYALTNLIGNGGFENAAPGLTSTYYNIGSTSGPNAADHAVPSDFVWTVSQGNVDIISYQTYGPPPSNPNSGSYGLDLVGYGSTGEISQSLNTVLGRVYTVSFDYKANPGISGPTAAIFDGTSPDPLTVITPIGSVTGGTSWNTFDGSFIGTGNKVVFSLNETLGGNNGGVFLDNISVTAVPEPATWISMILGFGLLGFTLRARKGAVLTA